MAEFTVAVTKAGLALLAQTMDSGTLTFTSIQLGSGSFTGAVADAQALVHPMKSLPVSRLVKSGTPSAAQITARAVLEYNQVETGFTWTEIGLFAESGGNKVLYAYGYAGDKGDYIPGKSETTLTDKIIRVTVTVGNAANVTIAAGSTVYASKEELDAVSEKVEKVVSGSAETGSTVVTLTHSRTVNGVHTFTGLGNRTGLVPCQFRSNAAYTEGDTASIDGVEYTITLTGADTPETDFFIAGKSIFVDVNTADRTINFKAGGGLTRGKLSLADADEDTVFSGKTFYSGDKSLKTGRALSTPTTAGTSDIASGKTAYNQLGKLLTGTGRAVLAGSLQPPLQERTYTIPYNNNLGKPKAILCYFNVWIGDYAAAGRHPSFSPYFFRGAASGQLMGMTSAAGGTMLNQNQTAANTTISVGNDSFSVTISKYDYVSGCEFDYLLVW